MNLDELTIEQITSGPVPLDGLLKGSLFYPACCTDGRPIKLCNTAWRPLGINSFVYCDFAVSVSHHMEYAVYDITDSTMDVDALLDWLILMPEPN